MELQDGEIHIRYLPYHSIDKGKWDACIRTSDHPLLYATSVYLDGMCNHWDALVSGNYEAVMPLPWNRKWTIRYVYSPYFVVAGGVFGKGITETLFNRFLTALGKHFSYADLDLNECNMFTDLPARNGISYRLRRNTLLSLHQSYDQIFSGYSTLAKRKLKKADRQVFSLDRSMEVEKVISLYKQYYFQDPVVTKFDFTRMIALLKGKLLAQTKTYLLSFPDEEICAFYLLLFDDNYVYWLIGGSTGRGREAGAFYHLTDLVIRDFASTDRTFRFEGSDHDGIYFFNQQFGGQTVLYPHLKINRLPWPFLHLK